MQCSVARDGLGQPARWFTGERLAYYDVRTQRLHIGAEREALNIRITKLSKFKETLDGEDDIADVLLLQEYTEERGENAPKCDSDDDVTAGHICPLVGLHHRMLRGHETQSVEEQAYNFDTWVHLATRRLEITTSFLSNWWGESDPEIVRAEIATLLEMEAAWPQAMEAAYSKLWKRIAVSGGDNALFARNTIRALAQHHLDRMVHRMSEESVQVLQRCVQDPDFQPDAANKLPFSEELYEMAFAARKWPASFRCAWVTMCVQGALTCSTSGKSLGAVKRQ